MKKKFTRLIFIPSGIAIMLLMSRTVPRELILSAFIGLVLGILFCCVKFETHFPVNRTERIINTLLTVIFCIAGARSCFDTWGKSVVLKMLLERIFPDFISGLIFLVFLLAVLAFPLLAYIMLPAITWIVYLFKIVNFKEILNKITENISPCVLFKRTAFIILNLLTAIIVGVIMLLVAYSLPIDQIESHVNTSAVTISKEGAYPDIYPWCLSKLDNFTDSIMLLEAADHTDAPILEKAMYVYRGNIAGYSSYDTLVAHYLQNAEYTATQKYPRYWHGYLTVLKPLLELTDYNGIRIINGIVQLTLFFITCLLLAKRKLKPYILPYTLCYLMLMPVALAKSLQFSSCYYVFTASAIALLLLKEEKRHKCAYIVFLNTGIAIAYFDFLTYPIATFGIPAAICLALNKTDSLESKLIGLMQNGISWCLGYGIMWASKWIIASAITGSNVIDNALNAIANRTSSVSADSLTYYRILPCFSNFIYTPFTLLAIAYSVYIIFRYIKGSRLEPERIGNIVFPYTVLSLTPPLWYIIVRNHSSIHFWFTNKACVVILISLLFSLTEIKQHISTPQKNR